MSHPSQPGDAARSGATLRRQSAIKFVVLTGIVSLFADATYEGARSITGPFLQVLGAGGAAVGFVAGFGELIGYGLRLASGYLADRTHRYWLVTAIGYCVNVLAVPLLALAGNWETAACLMVMERAGKAIRTPPRDAMLSHATSQTGHGWGFGLHEALDQIGAVMGPLLVAFVLVRKHSYPAAFGWLLLPAILTLSFLAISAWLYPNPQKFEIPHTLPSKENFPRRYWVYLAGAALIGAGYADFPLIAFHLQKMKIAQQSWIPLLYAMAMGIDAIAALICGRFFDRIGIKALIAAVVLSAFFAPFAFLGKLGGVVFGLILWGIGMGAQESIMRAAIAQMVPPEKRASAYGIFHFIFGICWFAGSALMGVLYDVSIPALIAFSVAAQLCALPFLYKAVDRSNPATLR
ncbi:MAG TPA: MFS transporter [Acidobacteriota bacterium]|nr:MFS transporter [Acidobacteriota bacterium]